MWRPSEDGHAHRFGVAQELGAGAGVFGEPPGGGRQRAAAAGAGGAVRAHPAEPGAVRLQDAAADDGAVAIAGDQAGGAQPAGGAIAGPAAAGAAVRQQVHAGGHRGAGGTGRGAREAVGASYAQAVPAGLGAVRGRALERPGFVRVDTVHQGDLDGVKGVYHINVVDEVTQYQAVGSVETISERHLLPVLEQLLAAFPFAILGFHSDNGSEYVNRRVAKLLEKLRAEFTKSRPRRSTDNALCEGKNGSVVRKHLGYGHIPGRFAEPLNRFNREVLTPYLNYHRPCLFASEREDPRTGRIRKRYRHGDVRTPSSTCGRAWTSPSWTLRSGR